MTKVNIHQAKTHLSRLLQRVAAGEQVIISNRGVPVARLVPAERGEVPEIFGAYKGKLTVPDDFDDPLPDDMLAAFMGTEPGTGRRRKRKARKKT